MDNCVLSWCLGELSGRGNSPHRVRRNCKLTIRLAISDGRRCNRWGMFGLIGEGVVKFVAEDACLRCRLRISPAVLLAMNLYLVSATIFRVEGLCSKSMAIVVMRRLIRTKSIQKSNFHSRSERKHCVAKHAHVWKQDPSPNSVKRLRKTYNSARLIRSTFPCTLSSMRQPGYSRTRIGSSC